MAGHRKTAFQQVGTRYIDDPSWGMVYEIAVVVNTKIDYELMSTYMEEVKNQMKEKQDLETDTVKITYFKKRKCAKMGKSGKL